MDPLREILDAEGGIAQMLEAERSKAATWLAESKLALERAAQEEIDRLTAASTQEETSIRQAAEARAAAIVQRASALADHMRRMDEERLAGIVWEHIQAIVPGPDHDCQDVQD